jgi:hypothetical protein
MMIQSSAATSARSFLVHIGKHTIHIPYQSFVASYFFCSSKHKRLAEHGPITFRIIICWNREAYGRKNDMLCTVDATPFLVLVRAVYVVALMAWLDEKHI